MPGLLKLNFPLTFSRINVRGFKIWAIEITFLLLFCRALLNAQAQAERAPGET